MEDQAIIELYQARSETAISQTAAKYGRYCHAIAYRILQNDADAEECVSDTYLRAWNSIPPQCPRDLQSYLGRITRNLSLHVYDKRRAAKRGGGQVEAVLEELAECLPASPQGEVLGESWFIREALSHFLAELPPKTRGVFVRRYWYLQSAKEIAQTLGMTESYVNVTLHRTRQKLRRALEREGVEV